MNRVNVNPTGSGVAPKQMPEPASYKSTLKDPVVTNVRTDKQLQSAELSGVKITLGEEQMIRAIDRTLKELEGPSATFEMSVHKETKSIIVRVMDRETGELIREVPAEKTLDLVAKLMEFAGILIDEKV